MKEWILIVIIVSLLLVNVYIHVQTIPKKEKSFQYPLPVVEGPLKKDRKPVIVPIIELDGKYLIP